MVKPLPSRVLAKPASRLSWPALLEGGGPPAAVKPAAPVAKARAEAPVARGVAGLAAPDEGESVEGVWSFAEIMRKESMSQERRLESTVPVLSGSRPRRPAVIGAVASVLALIFVVGIGAGLVVRAVPEAAAASTPDELDGRRRLDFKARPSHPLPAVIGASCSDARPALAPAPSPPPAVMTVASSANDGSSNAPPVDDATDLGDLDTRPAAAPATSARRPVKPAVRPAFASPSGRRPVPAPARAPGAAPGDRSADTLFAGRL